MKIIKEHSFKTCTGSTLHFISIPIEEGNILIETHNGKLMEEFSNPSCYSYFYVLKDNRVVHIPLGKEATIYEPYDAFIDHMEETHILKKIAPYPFDKKFIRLPNQHPIEYDIIRGEELQKKFDSGILIEKSYYQLPNGEILRYNISSGDVFKNKTEFEKYQSYMAEYYKYVKRKSSGEYLGLLTWNLAGINKYGSDTLEHIEELSSSLPDLLDAPKNIFDFTVNNLFKIDKHLYKHLITYEFQEKVIMPLIAYIGQTYLKNNGGNWVLLYDELNDLWLPDIRQADSEMKMIYHPISIILNPEEGQGIYLTLKGVYLHRASNPESWD